MRKHRKTTRGYECLETLEEMVEFVGYVEERL